MADEHIDIDNMTQDELFDIFEEIPSNDDLIIDDEDESEEEVEVVHEITMIVVPHDVQPIENFPYIDVFEFQYDEGILEFIDADDMLMHD